MDDEMNDGLETVPDTGVPLVERMALTILRVAALPFLIVGLILWAVIMLAFVLARGLGHRGSRLARVDQAAAGAGGHLRVAGSGPTRRPLLDPLHNLKRR